MLKKLGMKTLLVGGCIILVVTTCMVGVVTTFNQKFKVTDLGLKDMSELVTQTCTVTVIQDSKKNLTFFKDHKIPLTESRQIFSYDFDVDASILPIIPEATVTYDEPDFFLKPLNRYQRVADEEENSVEEPDAILNAVDFGTI